MYDHWFPVIQHDIVPHARMPDVDTLTDATEQLGAPFMIWIIWEMPFKVMDVEGRPEWVNGLPGLQFLHMCTHWHWREAALVRLELNVYFLTLVEFWREVVSNKNGAGSTDLGALLHSRHSRDLHCLIFQWDQHYLVTLAVPEVMMELYLNDGGIQHCNK